MSDFGRVNLDLIRIRREREVVVESAFSMGGVEVSRGRVIRKRDDVNNSCYFKKKIFFLLSEGFINFLRRF